MSNIEQAVKEAIEEFGELAHERFLIKSKLGNNPFGDFSCATSNDILVSIITKPEKLSLKYEIKLKPLPELFAHDVKFYGDNAYLMWKIENSAYEDEDNGMHDAKDNLEATNAIKSGCFVERKDKSSHAI